MKKIFFLSIVVMLAACGSPATEEATTNVDSTAVVVDTTPVANALPEIPTTVK